MIDDRCPDCQHEEHSGLCPAEGCSCESDSLLRTDEPDSEDD